MFFIYFIIFATTHMYIVKKLVNKVDISDRTRLYIKIFLFYNLISVVLYKLGRYSVNFESWFDFIISISLGVFFILLCVTIMYDFSLFILANSKFSSKRRKSFKKTLDISVPFVTSFLALKSVYSVLNVEIENVDIKINNLKRDYKVVQLSDIHIGVFINEYFMDSIVKKVNELEPDIIVITGDLVGIELKKAKPALSKLKKLKSKFGIYYVVGNREYIYDMRVIMDSLKSLGITVLENQNIYVGEKGKGFNLVGVYDINGYILDIFRPSLNKALIGIKKGYPSVLLAHQPRFVREVKDRVDLVLSGHTHGGQILPLKYLLRKQQIYVSGLHNYTDKVQVYVSKGVGFSGPPVRLGVNAEITNILLKAS